LLKKKESNRKQSKPKSVQKRKKGKEYWKLRDKLKRKSGEKRKE
jgi:hypothetical protein